ncbi:MAG: FAD:protein FMN transferase, partial [Chloroflexi bacterium]|nr:FAD:protein FMN transferase [Chloroflexota bacterium]
ALHSVEMLFAEVESVASRFQWESELSQLNRAAGQPFQASPLLFTLVASALNAARTSDGLFDLTILGPLLAAGYDRSFEFLVEDRGSAPNIDAGRLYSWHDIHLDAQTRTIFLPHGCGLDLGGIGKGLTVDRAAERLRGFSNYAIDAGGDIYVRGIQCDGNQWTVDGWRRGSLLSRAEHPCAQCA